MAPIYVDCGRTCVENLRQQLLALEVHLNLPASERAANFARVAQEVQVLNQELNKLIPKPPSNSKSRSVNRAKAALAIQENFRLQMIERLLQEVRAKHLELGEADGPPLPELPPPTLLPAA